MKAGEGPGVQVQSSVRAVGGGHLRQHRVIPLLLERPPRQVLLVALALGMREVVALVIMQREAQLALVRAQVVPHEVGVFLQVDRLQRQLPQPLSPVDLGLDVRRHPAAAGLGTPVTVHATHGGGRRGRLLTMPARLGSPPETIDAEGSTMGGYIYRTPARCWVPLEGLAVSGHSVVSGPLQLDDRDLPLAAHAPRRRRQLPHKLLEP